MTENINEDALFEAYQNLPHDARASLRYHISCDNEVSESFRENKVFQRLITIDDVESIIADIATRFKNLTVDQILSIRGKLESSIGASHDRLGDLQQAAAVSAASFTGAEALVPYRTQQQLWAEFDGCEKEIQGQFEELYRQGKITYEQMQYLRSERVRLDTLPHDRDARIKDEQAFAEYQMSLGIDIRDKAEARGDHTTKQAAELVLDDVAAQKQRLNEMWHQRVAKVEGERGEQKQSEHLTTPGHRYSDDPSSAIKIENVTYDDIRTPSSVPKRPISPEQTR